MSSNIEIAVQRVLDAGPEQIDGEEAVLRGLFRRLESERSLRTYASDLAFWFGHCRQMGLRPLAADRDAVQGYLVERRGLAPDTRRRMISVLRGFYREAIERELYAGRNPAEGLGRISGEARPAAAALSAEQVSQLLARERERMEDPDPCRSLLARRDHLLLSLLVWLGLRAAELVALRSGDLQTHGDYQVLVISGKGDKPALVKLTPALLAEIHDWQAASSAAGLSLGPEDALFYPIGRGWPLRGRRRGGRLLPISTRSLGRLVHARLRTMGLDGRRSGPHRLRRTSVTLVYQASHDLVLTQRHARHRSSNTTVKHYIKPADELAETGVDYIRLPKAASPPATLPKAASPPATLSKAASPPATLPKAASPPATLSKAD